MQYAYLLRSTSHPRQRYVGITANLQDRLLARNSDRSPHTAKFTPWEIVTYVCF